MGIPRSSKQRLWANAICVPPYRAHHEVHTRVLDWSRDPYVAAYFASAKAAHMLENKNEPLDSKAKLIVWALNERFLGVHEDLFAGQNSADSPDPTRFEIAHVPSPDNDNLRAQSGYSLVSR
jgi:hypothetical protein